MAAASDTNVIKIAFIRIDFLHDRAGDQSTGNGRFDVSGPDTTLPPIDLSGLPDGVVPYGDTENRLPHIACLGVPGVEAEAVLLGLDQAGVAAHSGSACSSESLEPSPVLEAMGVDAERSLRVSVGWSTTDDDITAFLTALPTVVEKLRALRFGEA